MSMGPSPSLGGGLAVQDCPTVCITLCDPKYFPRCSNDCMEQAKCCSGGGDNGGGNGGGSCPTVCPDYCDPKYAPGCSNDCYEQRTSCSCGAGSGSNSPPPKSTQMMGMRPLGIGGPVPPNSPCSPPVGIGPVLVPASGLPQSVVVYDFVGNSQISGLLVTCAETGVSMLSSCNVLTFFRPTAGSYSYSTPGGAGNRCSFPMNGHNYSSGLTSTASQVSIRVTQS